MQIQDAATECGDFQIIVFMVEYKKEITEYQMSFYIRSLFQKN